MSETIVKVNLPYRVQYAHQVRPETDSKPFDLRWAYATWHVFPPDEIDEVRTFQVVFMNKPISESRATWQEAQADACYWLMDQSRKEYAKGGGTLTEYQNSKAVIALFTI